MITHDALRQHLALKGHEGFDLDRQVAAAATRLEAVIGSGDVDTRPRLKLSQRDRKRLGNVLAQLLQGQEFLMEEKTLVCRRTSLAGGDDGYVNPKGDAVISINKEIGSALTILNSGIAELRNLLN